MIKSMKKIIPGVVISSALFYSSFTNVSAVHWFNKPYGFKLVINGVQRHASEEFYYGDTYDMKKIIPIFNGEYQEVNKDMAEIMYNNKKYVVDKEKQTVNGQKISVMHSNYMSKEVFDIIGIPYYEEKNNNIEIFMLGEKKLVSEMFESEDIWYDYSNFELKPNGYYAPKSYKALNLKVAKQTNPKKFNQNGLFEQYDGKSEAFLADSKIQDEKDYVTLGVNYYIDPLKAIHDIDSFIAFVPNVNIDERGKMLKTVYELVEKDPKITKNHQFIKKETYNNYDVYYTISKGSNFKHLILSFVEKGKNVTVIEY